MIVELYAKSDVGRVRRGNEDNFLVLDLSTAANMDRRRWRNPAPENLTRFDLGDKGLVLVVSDGMGGALAGDVASRMAVDSVREMLDGRTEDGLRSESRPRRVSEERHSLRQPRHSSEEPGRLALRGHGRDVYWRRVRGDSLDLVQVGDSRGYVIRKDQIRLATKDQSLVQQLVDVGQISESEAETHMFRNVILQALGAQSEVTPVTGKIRLRQDDLVLLCSDGLSGKLRAEDIQRIVLDSNGDLAKACDALIEEANNRGGEDNITVVLARFLVTISKHPPAIEITIELPPLEEDKTLDDTYEADTEPQNRARRQHEWSHSYPALSLFVVSPFVQAPVGFATDPLHIDRRAFNTLNTNSFACFEWRFARRRISGPRRSKHFHRAFLQRSLTRRNHRPNLSRQRIHTPA